MKATTEGPDYDDEAELRWYVGSTSCDHPPRPRSLVAVRRILSAPPGRAPFLVTWEPALLVRVTRIPSQHLPSKVNLLFPRGLEEMYWTQGEFRVVDCDE